MFKKPTVAIIGRPNVGKSALFNRIARKRIAIVDQKEGVTRDYLAVCVEGEFSFRLLDTGGIDPGSKGLFRDEIIAAAKSAVAQADILVMVVDGEVGATALDEEIAHMLLKTGKPLTLAVNKIDDPSHERRLAPFYKLGIKKVMGVSALHGTGVHELLVDLNLPTEVIDTQVDVSKIAIVGRPNVGKSTLVNALLKEERVIVSPLAGTTRDAVDIPLSLDGKDYLLIDTAGVKKKKSDKENAEMCSQLRRRDAIERADIALLLLDASTGLTDQDKHLLSDIEESGKPCLILLNKWDLVHGYRMEHIISALRLATPFLAHVPILILSAKQGRNLHKLFPAIHKLLATTQKRLSTALLNRFLTTAQAHTRPPMLGGKRLRIYYMTQVSASPPRFLLFVNSPTLMDPSYQKYLLNSLRTTFNFAGTPLKLHLKGKSAPKH